MAMVARDDALGQERYEISQSRLEQAEALVKTLPVQSFRTSIVSKVGEVDPNNIEGDIELFDVSSCSTKTMKQSHLHVQVKSYKLLVC